MKNTAWKKDSKRSNNSVLLLRLLSFSLHQYLMLSNTLDSLKKCRPETLVLKC